MRSAYSVIGEFTLPLDKKKEDLVDAGLHLLNLSGANLRMLLT